MDKRQLKNIMYYSDECEYSLLDQYWASVWDAGPESIQQWCTGIVSLFIMERHQVWVALYRWKSE